MPKYGQIKYGQRKYGRYDIEIQDDTIDLSQLTTYKLSSIDSKKRETKPIINQSVKIINSGGPITVRIKSDNGKWIYHQSVNIQGNPPIIRIKAVGTNSESPWIESVIGTIRKRVR